MTENDEPKGDKTVVRFLGMELSGSELLLIAAFGFGILHHIDHVLRHDHIGWPLIPEVAPFTVSFSFYLILATVFFARRWPWYRVLVTGATFAILTYVHILWEPPTDQFVTWAVGSQVNLPGSIPGSNLLGKFSPFLGWLSVLLSMLVSVSLFAATIGFIRDWLSRRSGAR